ncbi:MAG: hypothetical protein WA865_10550 [Spirulinaceae cyanobacterium]
MATKPQNKKVIDSDTKFALLVFGIPIAGLIYCGLGITAMVSFPFLRQHALISGGFFLFTPFSIAASIWIRASAKAYRKTG